MNSSTASNAEYQARKHRSDANKAKGTAEKKMEERKEAKEFEEKEHGYHPLINL